MFIFLAILDRCEFVSIRVIRSSSDLRFLATFVVYRADRTDDFSCHPFASIRVIRSSSGLRLFASFVVYQAHGADDSRLLRFRILAVDDA